MLVRNRSTGAVITEDEFRRTHPTTSFPAQLTTGLLDAFDHDPVLNGAQPTGEPWQSAVSDGVEQINGQWFTRYVLTPETITPELLELHRTQKLAALAAKRWEVETSGILVGGVPVKTDEDTQRKVTGAYVQADKNPDFSVKWKVATGQFVDLNASMIVAIIDALTNHVQECFFNESELSAQIIAAADWSTLAAIDITTGWPT